MKTPEIAHDKLLHFAAGTLSGLPAIALGYFVPALAPWAWALLLAVAVGVGKEIYDYASGGTVDHMDTVATVAGAMPVVLAFLVLGG